MQQSIKSRNVVFPPPIDSTPHNMRSPFSVKEEDVTQEILFMEAGTNSQSIRYLICFQNTSYIESLELLLFHDVYTIHKTKLNEKYKQIELAQNREGGGGKDGIFSFQFFQKRPREQIMRNTLDSEQH